ncbi:MAG: hypothetical protein ABIR68_11265 [Ilumatobacteraceae bacterium]
MDTAKLQVRLQDSFGRGVDTPDVRRLVGLLMAITLLAAACSSTTGSGGNTAGPLPPSPISLNSSSSPADTAAATTTTGLTTPPSTMPHVSAPAAPDTAVIDAAPGPEQKPATTPPQATAPAATDGCEIVSDTTAVAVLGVELARREGKVDTTGTSKSCIKGTARVVLGAGGATDLSAGFYVAVGVLAGGAPLFDNAATEDGSLPVPGIGDRAAFNASIGTLFIVVGSTYVQIQVVKAGAPGNQQDTQTVATDVLAHI